MSVERARAFLSRFGMEDKIITFKESSATVELAAKAAGTEPARIAKTLSFAGKEYPVLIVTAGDTKIDNAKFKHFFGIKAHMLPFAEALCRSGGTDWPRSGRRLSLRRERRRQSVSGYFHETLPHHVPRCGRREQRHRTDAGRTGKIHSQRRLGRSLQGLAGKLKDN